MYEKHSRKFKTNIISQILLGVGMLIQYSMNTVLTIWSYSQLSIVITNNNKKFTN